MYFLDPKLESHDLGVRIETKPKEKKKEEEEKVPFKSLYAIIFDLFYIFLLVNKL